ncbi:SDR family oxidoreductase [Kitasatospora azatica]|uniref:SDR family oxidoreductase n=1 Tax=Kitasatospora azatica TaxID=58347 RepID=UPI000559D457|nr:SDR family oxidoreductase [Kitasatospora azatica]
MSEALTGRVAVVTGAASGIGAATARVLAEQGAKVALLARRQDRLEAVAAQIAEAGGEALVVPADVTDERSMAAAVEQVAPLGTVDLVVTGAGSMLTSPFDLGRAHEWDRMISTNLTGLVRTIHVFEPQLAEAARAGRPADVVNISSIGATAVAPNFALYCATKAAVSHLSRNLRTEFGPKGIRVTAFEPGVVDTELISHVDDAPSKEWLEGLIKSIDVLSDRDIAELIAYTVGLPKHINLSQVVVMPTQQA